MTYEEKGIWVYLVVAVGAYGTYLAIVLGQVTTVPIAGIDYVPALLWSIGASIVGAIVLRILVEIVTPSENYRSDVRDKSISRQGDAAGNALIVVGALGGLILALLAQHPFWIANVIYLSFVLSALVSSIVRIAAYRGAIASW